MPWFAGFMVLFAMANCGLPGTSGFVGEFMVILAAFQESPLIALLAAFTLIIGAAYTLWLVKRVVYGEIGNDKVAKMQDLDAREWIVLGSFAVAVIALGVYPKPLIDLMEPAVLQLVQQIGLAKL
jgi:NADH-quinone oxidoreductase subunit M